MENLISSIQHFFITTFAAVTTTIMVALPFHKPPIYPTSSPKQEIQVKKEATISAKVLGVSQNTPTNQQTESKPTDTVPPKPSQLPAVTHDGSRTGQIIDYAELCTGKTIKVYENEVITKVATDGKTYSRTKGDWDCLNRNTTTQPHSGSTNSTNNPSNGGNSTGNNYVYSPGYTYNYPTPNPPSINNGTTRQSPAPVNTPQPVDHSLDLQICLNNEERSWEIQMDDLNRRGVWSSGQAEQARSDHAARVQSCHLRWGN